MLCQKESKNKDFASHSDGWTPRERLLEVMAANVKGVLLGGGEG